MSEHTPGPWEARPFEGPHRERYIWTAGRPYLQDHCVATVAGVDKVLYHEGMIHAEGTVEANARLIAAAPALLAALEEGIALIDQLAQTRRHWSARQQGIFEHMERARDLARGGLTP